MNKNVLAAIPAALALGVVAPSLMAQDEGGADTDGTETEAADPNGAIVTREVLTEEREVLDENGEPVLDENGNPTFETVELDGWVQTVETPSGHVHTVTKVAGERAIVTHEFAERPEKPERPERPEKPEKPEKPERPERPERPGRGG